MDQLAFPATPEEMGLILVMEDIAKEEGIFNEDGMAAVVVMPNVTDYSKL